jgi:hypothetical protein
MQVACQFFLYHLGTEDLGDIIYKALEELKKRVSKRKDY